MPTSGSSFTLLHSFAAGASDGGKPYGNLILSGSTLYGMTANGGSSGAGTIFSIGTDGLGFKVLHTFTGASADGGYPSGSLTLVGSTLYGMTNGGGSSGAGTIFSIGTDGSGFTVLRSLTSGTSDGGSPTCNNFVLSGTTDLYGMTVNGGSSNGGIIFDWKL